MAADVVGYSRLMGLDEEGALSRLKSLRRDTFEPVVRACGGRIFKLTGDGALVEFPSAVDAVRSGIDIQRALAEVNRDAPDDGRIELRIGISLGDVIVEGTDLYGNGVNIAARLEQLAEPGAICIAGNVREHVRQTPAAEIEDLGPLNVKNIAEPVHAFMIRPERPATSGEAREMPRAAPGGAPSAGARPSVAVLAFNNMSGDPEQTFFSDGISEDIITDLSKISELHVIARNSSFVYKESAVSIPQVGRELGVRYVLEGSVRRAGNRVRVTAQLIDATTGGHVWADRYDRDLTDIFEVQDEVTREIVGALRLRLTDDEQDRLVHRRVVPIEAYELFLRGREQTWLHTEAGNEAARPLFERAIAIAPSYTAAQARIAFTHAIDYVNGWSGDPERSLRTGCELARRAVELDEAEPQAHFALSIASLWSRDLDTALSAAERCLELAPSLAEGYLAKAHTHIYGGDGAAALETIETYMKLDPHYPEIALHFVAEAHFTIGDFAQAAAALEKRIGLNPVSETAHALLASCYGHLGRLEESRAMWEKVLALNPDFSHERRRRVQPFRDPADFEKRLDGLRHAGLL